MPEQHLMNAVVFEHYGSAEELKVVEMPVPEPQQYEVLVRVRAAGVNPLDWKIRKGEMRFIPGQYFPHRLGSDFAGEITTVGGAVREFKVGDEVLGWMNTFQGAAYAEYVAVGADSVVAKPPALSFAQAAAVPTAGIAALQGLRDVGRLLPGQRVLLNGCTGGVGMFATPLAKSLGAHVTGVCGPKSVGAALRMGADVVLDYSTVDLFSLSETFDVIFDLAGRFQFSAIRHLLTPCGIFVDPAPTPAVMAGSVIGNLFHAQKHGILISKMNAADVKRVLEVIKTQSIPILISGEFPLDQVAAAHIQGEKGGGLGKIVLTL